MSCSMRSVFEFVLAAAIICVVGAALFGVASASWWLISTAANMLFCAGGLLPNFPYLSVTMFLGAGVILFVGLVCGVCVIFAVFGLLSNIEEEHEKEKPK